MVLHIIVLIFEVLYYSIFMKFTKKEGKFWKYLLLFSLITIFLFVFNTNNLYAYLIFILLALYGLKYIIKTKISLYDMLWIVLMLISKTLVEIVFGLSINFIINNIEISKLILGFIKILVLFIFSKKLNLFYKNLRIKWNENNFYIRYIFVILVYLYVIASCLFLIFI